MSSVNSNCGMWNVQCNCEDSTHYSIENCKQCELNGFPNEKIFLKFVGLRPETEDGFIYKFAEYDYSNVCRKHFHKWKEFKATTAKARSKYDIANILHVFSS